MIERIHAEGMDRVIALRNEFCLQDPYILQRTAEEFLAEHHRKMEDGSLQIRLLIQGKSDAGYSLLEEVGETGWIQELFVSSKNREVRAYTVLLEDAKEHFEKTGVEQVCLICLENPMERTSALCDFGFDLIREHVQMEMPLQEVYVNKPDLLIKPFYSYSDGHWLLDWITTCSAKPGLYSQREIDGLIMKRESFAFVACQGSEPVGFMIAEVNEQRNRQERQQVLYIEHMAVSPAFRMQGIATRMLDLVFREALHLGLTTARLHVFHDNAAAYRLYEKLGFVEVKRINYWRYVLGG